MTVLERITVVLAAVLLVGAFAVTFMPHNEGVVHCGTWISPNWPDDKTAELVDEAGSTSAQANAAGKGEIADQSQSIADTARLANAACSGPLSTRRTVSVSLGVGALLIGPALAFVAAGARRRPHG